MTVLESPRVPLEFAIAEPPLESLLLRTGGRCVGLQRSGFSARRKLAENASVNKLQSGGI